MRRIAYALFLSLLSLPLAAQTVTVTASNILGINGQPLGQGYLCYTPVAADLTPQAFTSNGKQYYATEQCWRVFAGVASGVTVPDTSETNPAIGYLPVIRDISKKPIQTYSEPYYPTAIFNTFDTWQPTSAPLALGAGLINFGTSAPTGLCTSPSFGYLTDGSLYLCGSDQRFHAITSGGGVTSSNVITALGYTPTSPTSLSGAIASVPAINSANIIAGLGYTPVSPATLASTLSAIPTVTSSNIITALGYTPTSPTSLSTAIAAVPTVNSSNVITALGYTPTSPSTLSSAIAAVPVINYTNVVAGLGYVPLPASGGTVSGSFAACETNNIFTVDGCPSSGTVNGTTYSTQFDYTVATALAYGTANDLSPVVQVGTGVYQTCTGIQMSATTQYGISILGAGRTDDQFGGGKLSGTKLKQTCSISTPVLNSPPIDVPSGTYRYNLRFENFTIDANGDAPSCWELSAIARSDMRDVGCMNASGSDHWAAFGLPNVSGFTTTDDDLDLADIYIQGQGAYYANWALVTAAVSGGNIATNGYTVASSGTGYVRSTVPAYLQGHGAAGTADYPCTTMPTGLHATISGGAVTAVTSTAGASGCSGTVYVAVPDLATAAYGVRFYNLFDSKVNNLAVSHVGQAAALYDLGGGANKFDGIHTFEGQPFALESHGQDIFTNLYCDGVTYACANIQGDSPTFIGTTPLWGAGSTYGGGEVEYYIAAGQGRFFSNIADVPSPTAPTGYNRYWQSGYGPLLSTDITVLNHMPTRPTIMGGMDPNDSGGNYSVTQSSYVVGDLHITGTCVGCNNEAATPTFSVTGGTYTSAQSVSLSDATGGVAISYCVSMTGDCTPSLPYTAALSVSSAETICSNALTGSGGIVSATSCNAYIINAGGTTPTGTGIGTIIAQGYETDGSIGFKTCYVGGSVCSGGVGSITLSSVPTHTFGLNTPSANTGLSNKVGDFHLETATPGASGTQFSMALWTTSGGGFGANPTATNFYVGGWLKPVYPAGPSRIEFDAYEFDNNTDWMFGTQCNSDKMLIQTDNQAPSWTYTSMPCAKLYDGNYHHVEFTFHRTLAGDTSCSGMPCECWDTGAIDGVTTALNICKPATTATGWSGSGWQFQIDGAPTTASGGSPAKYDLYVDSAQFISGLAGTPGGATGPAGGGVTTTGTGDLDSFNFDGGLTTPTGLTAVGSPSVSASKEHSSPNSAHFPSGLNYYTDTITPTNTVYTRQYVYLNTVNGSLSNSFLRFYHGSTELFVYFFDTPSQHITYFDQATSSSIAAYSTTFPTAGWHYIETYTKIDPTAGHVTVKVDGSQVYDSGSFNTGTLPVDTVWFGNIGSTAPTGWDTYEDNVDFDDSNWIGPI